MTLKDTLTRYGLQWCINLDVEEFNVLGRKSSVSCRIIDFIALHKVQAVESQELENGNLEVRILTTDEGRNRGRVYVFDLPWQEGQERVERARTVSSQGGKESGGAHSARSMATVSLRCCARGRG